MSKPKARDIIPGWPRGRSTSNLGSGNIAREYIFWPACYWLGISDEMKTDSRFLEDVAGEEAEDRRKAEMMEEWYKMERIKASGIFSIHWP